MTQRLQQKKSPRLMGVGGGTGGHLYPGIAVADAWLGGMKDGQVIFVGSPSGIEARVIPELGHPFVAVESRRLKNAGLVERLRSLVRMPMAIFRGYRIIRRENPSVILGVGGYVSGPVVLAAALSGRPCAVAEQNAKPGLTNRILGRFVRRVYTAFPEAGQRFPTKKIRELGNPVRAAFRTETSAPKGQDRGQNILILGGSQGAKALNEQLPLIIAKLKVRFPRLAVVHQTGRDRDQPVKALYSELKVTDVSVEPFIDNMAQAMDTADLVIARAGATTVAELACIGRAAVFIPFPYAADDHQAANAQSLVSVGAALMQREEAMNTESMVELLEPLLADRGLLDRMGASALSRGRPEAAHAIVTDLADLGGMSQALCNRAEAA
jgi:UDP-N-acetylglucosamine--N-acetylmuramyl-(pentapeptide) pyrophosphoryl-undecaprenol N-acetylglucosamine transferase